MKRKITAFLAASACLASAIAMQASVQQFNPAKAIDAGSHAFPRSLPLSVTHAYTASQTTVIPAEGRVKSLKEFTITFADAQSVTRGNVGYGNAPTVHKTGDPDGSKQYCFNMAFDGNKMTLNVNNEITEEGDWTLTLPAGFYLVDGTESTETLEFSYTIASAVPVEGEIIYEAPIGTKVECMTRVLGWAVINDQLVGQEFCGKPMHYVIGDDGCLYIYNAIILNPFLGEQMNTYIKGVKDGDDYVFNFPQPVYEETVDGQTKTWYVNRLKMEIYDNNSSDYVISDENSVRIKINEDGSIETSQPMDAPYDCVGTMVDGKWNGFGSTRMLYRVFNFTAAEPPADLETNGAEMEYDDADGYLRTIYPKYGIVGNDIWIQGFGVNVLPDAWVHGTINGDQVSFDPYMGCSDHYGQYVFLRGCEYTQNLKLYPAEFTFDRENMTLTCNTNLCLNSNNEFYYAFEMFQQCTINMATDDPGLTSRVPKGPVAITRFEAVDADAGTFDMAVELSNLNIDRQPLEEKRLTWQVILPDSTVYTFQPYRYSGISKAITDVPYDSFELPFIEISGDTRTFTIKDAKGIDNIGARIIYKDATGAYASDIVWFKQAGVSDPAVTGTSALTEWHDMTGRKVSSPGKGIYVRTDRDAEGRRTIRKVIIK